MFKRTVAAITILAAMLCLGVKVDAADTRHTKEDTWLVYMYICGTNLEEGKKDANGDYTEWPSNKVTRDIADMQKVKLPPNVKVLLNVNGATEWNHPTFKANGNGIYLYGSKHLEKLTDWNANMGDPATLKAFLEYGEKNFPADHKVLIFWDHGGLNGLCYDSNFSNKARTADGKLISVEQNLTFDNLTEVLTSVYGNSPEELPFELIGFNTCLSASYELANSIADFSHYMVGSEPSEYGWYFAKWLSALANDPALDGEQLGKIVCDSTMATYKFWGRGIEPEQAFSVIDLTKMPKLREAYEEYLDAAIDLTNEKAGFTGAFSRAATARNNDRYSELYMDLSVFAQNTKNILPKESKKLLRAIDEAVVYNKRGKLLNGKGISTYYPFVSTASSQIDTNNLENFKTQNSSPEAQKNLYDKLIDLDISNLQLTPVEYNSTGHVVAKLNPEQLENVSMVRLIVFNEKGELVSVSEDNLKVDWKRGIVTENFRATQPMFEGRKISLESSGKGRGHNVYEFPIIVSYANQNIPCVVTVKYDFSKKKYSRIAIEIVGGNGARRQPYRLKNGYVIRTLSLEVIPEDSPEAQGAIRYTDPKTGNSALYKVIAGEPFVFTETSVISDKKIRNGAYVCAFQFIAPNGSATASLPFLVNVDYNGIERYIPDEEDLNAAG